MGETKVVEKKDSIPVIRVSGFKKAYRKHVAVCGVDLSVNSGEIYGLIGPDGSGKSTLMKAIAGVLTFDEGEVEIFGTKIISERTAEKIKHLIGFMPQGLGLNLYPELSVEENIDFFARIRMVPKEELTLRKKRLLEMTRLDQFRDRPMKNLSGGMKQKLGLVCTLIHEPDLVILDEPTTGVDPVSRRDFWAILSEILRERGITALVSTAYMDEAMRFHQTSVMFKGQILAQGEMAQIINLVPGAVVTCHAEPQAYALVRLKSCFSQVVALGPQLRVFVEKAKAEDAVGQVRRTLKGLDTNTFDVWDPELEDVLIALMHKQGAIDAESDEQLSFSPAVANLVKRNGVAIEAQELVRDFGAFRAVDRVSFSVPEGEIFGLLGSNGAGKTTVIKMLTGILSPTSGEGLVAGSDMRGAGINIKEHIGYMSQAFSLYRDLTVVENIRLYAGIYGLSRKLTKERTNWIIKMAGLEGHETDLAGRLPMGVSQRLALGCALVHRPRVLFLDEPTSGVDPNGRRRFWDILFKLSREEGVTILVTTHYMSEAEHCDHLCLMHTGRIVADASPVEMKRQVEKEAGIMLDVGTDKPLISMDLLEKAHFKGVSLFGNRIHLLDKEPQTAIERIHKTLEAGGVTPLDIRERPLSMEDVFIHRVLTLEKEDRAIS
jgi:drug efflux transport system ATP-binding protein